MRKAQVVRNYVRIPYVLVVLFGFARRSFVMDLYWAHQARRLARE